MVHGAFSFLNVQSSLTLASKGTRLCLYTAADLCSLSAAGVTAGFERRYFNIWIADFKQQHVLSNENQSVRNLGGPFNSKAAPEKFNFPYADLPCVFAVAGEAPELSISLRLILQLQVLTLGYEFRARFDGS